MDKLTINVLSEKVTWKPLQIDSGTHELLSRLSRETGVSMARLVSECVKFCENRIEVFYD